MSSFSPPNRRVRDHASLQDEPHPRTHHARTSVRSGQARSTSQGHGATASVQIRRDDGEQCRLQDKQVRKDSAPFLEANDKSRINALGSCYPAKSHQKAAVTGFLRFSPLRCRSVPRELWFWHRTAPARASAPASNRDHVTDAESLGWRGTVASVLAQSRKRSNRIRFNLVSNYVPVHALPLMGSLVPTFTLVLNGVFACYDLNAPIKECVVSAPKPLGRKTLFFVFFWRRGEGFSEVIPNFARLRLAETRQSFLRAIVRLPITEGPRVRPQIANT